MGKYRAACVALIATTLLLFNHNVIAAESTLEATPEEVALIKYVKENGGMVSFISAFLLALNTIFIVKYQTFFTNLDLDQRPQNIFLSLKPISPSSQVKYEIGRECPTCLRGAIATENIPKDNLIISVPLSLGILLPRIDRRAFASEYAHGLLLQFKTDPIFNKTHSLFWSTQPSPEDILNADVLPDHLIEQLHTPELARLMRSQRQVGINVYKGLTRWADYASLPEVLTGENAVSLDYFLYFSAIVGTRDFALSEESVNDDSDGPAFWLLPVADMVNHEDNATARRSDNGTHVEMFATRDIKKGEAVTNNYQENVLDRNDMCLHIYGKLELS